VRPCSKDMLAKEVEHLLARQAELASHLAQVRREKELLEGENDILYAEAEQNSNAKSATKMVSEQGTSPMFEETASPRKEGRLPPPLPARTTSTSVEKSALPSLDERPPSPCPRWPLNETTSAPHPSTVAPKPSTHLVRRKSLATAGATATATALSRSDGPDAELAAKLIGRLNRAGESDEAQVLTKQVDSLLSQQEKMKQSMEIWKSEKTAMEAEMMRLKELDSSASPNGAPRRNGPHSEMKAGAVAMAATAAAAEARIAAKEHELVVQTRNLEKTVATRVRAAIEEAAAARSEAEAGS